ncbi:hypothetical protein GobsT_30220 [Gemmata obscuriglobus]|uniref:Uncharacterized protein n=2 Tax=Gemmata TaxID=113 RepID=A0A2Z3H520_9BACT|nr:MULTISPECIES: hypothetical protein [Gemmata]AWM38777.1 hypothetical protein C1280_18475 [Gemmata obscuriglobus]MDY3553308.1 hypothetical protein [Gemmata algarum]MDY3561838.1 hypothetical protein [Gemmata algarum]QEG28246.1 hypothetical protein GobsT_30220 [Gemmata obscuriglobus]VTS06027.1 unnamed protein product [Gemmata obscuriglobus UQM 2246]
MTKIAYFYTDPVAALWMAKTYRLKLVIGTFCLQSESLDTFIEMLGKGARPDRIAVAAESVPVLDPKPGDVVEETANGKTKVKRLATKDFPLTGSNYDILQRSGKAFIMPERARG